MMMHTATKYGTRSFLVFLVWLFAGQVSWGQSGSFGNTFIHSGGEMVIFGTHNFQNGGSGILPGVVGTHRQPGIGVLSFTTGASWVNASGSQHADGYVRSYLSGRFVFPIGDNGQYYPAAVSAASAAQPATAAYYAVNPSLAITSILGGGNYPILPPGGPFPTWAMGPGVTVVDTTGYWDIDGNEPAQISLTWDAAKNISSFTSNLSSVKMVGWNGFEWERIPSSVDGISVLGVPSTLTEGSVTSSLLLVPSAYTVYALAIGCLADTVPPVLSEDTLYAYCPTNTADLGTITALGLSGGTLLTFHTDSIATAGNEMDSLVVGPGMYYAAQKDTANLCYSPTVPVYVLAGPDTVAPVIVGCPTDITVPIDAGTCSAVVTWPAPSATDICGGTVNVTSTHNPGDVFPEGVTTVTYIFTDSAGNSVDCMFDVTVNDTEVPTIIACPGNMVSCTGTASWAVPTATDNCAGVVSVFSTHNPGDTFPVGVTTVQYVFTDATGNADTCSFTVTVSKPVLTPVAGNVSCSGANDGSAAVMVAGVEPFAFSWVPAGTDSLLTNLAPGVYSVTVTDALGCQDSVSITVKEPLALMASVESVTAAYCGFSNGAVQVLTEGGTPDYSFVWSDGQTTQNLYGVPEGMYSLEVTDANGCSDTLNVSLSCGFTKIPQLVTPNGDGHNDTWVIPGIEEYKDAVVEIYNRWGNLVYKASPYLNDWAGYSTNVTDVGQGKLPAGTYFYVITLKKGEKALTGYIELQY